MFSSHPEQPLDGFAQFFPRGDEVAVLSGGAVAVY